MIATVATAFPRPSISFQERRTSPRRRVLKGGLVSFNEGCSDFPCTVRDISESGARLVVRDGVYMPRTFELVIELDGTLTPCEVVWREIGAVGVRFLSAPRDGAPRRVQVLRPSDAKPALAPTLRRKPISA